MMISESLGNSFEYNPQFLSSFNEYYTSFDPMKFPDIMVSKYAYNTDDPIAAPSESAFGFALAFCFY